MTERESVYVVNHVYRFFCAARVKPVYFSLACSSDDTSRVGHLSPEEAQQSEILDGQRLYPLYNAKVEANSLGFRNGIVNQFPFLGKFSGVVEVADIPNTAGNSQPFVIDTQDNGMTYVMAMEPHGESSHGLDEVWFYDASTGEKEYFRTGEQRQLFGPERAMDIVRSEDSHTGWVANTEGGNFKVIEPVPTFIDGELWWHSKVVTSDDTDVARSFFVNADTQEAVSLRRKANTVAFISGEDVEEMGNTTTEPSQTDDNIAYYIVVREDGEVVERIPVKEGQTTTIEENTNSTTNSTSTG